MKKKNYDLMKILGSEGEGGEKKLLDASLSFNGGYV